MTADFDTHGVQYYDFFEPSHAGFSISVLPHEARSMPATFWSVSPSAEAIRDNSVSWLCNSIANRKPTETLDPSIRLAVSSQGKKRQVLVGYDSPSYGALTKDFVSHLADECGGVIALDPASPMQVDDAGNIASPLLPHANAAVVRMKDQRDTSLLCYFCTGTIGDNFAQAEAANQYFPEYLFIDGQTANPYGARTFHNPNTFNNAFGLTDLWQVPAYLSTYWARAYRSVAPLDIPPAAYAFPAYELFMQVFATIQLAGAQVEPTSDAQVQARNAALVTTGLYGWQRRFLGSNPMSPSAGYTSVDHTFVKGLIEQRWDASGSPPGGPLPGVEAAAENGCYRIIDNDRRYADERYTSDLRWGLSQWPRGPASAVAPDNGDHSVLSGPCTGDYTGDEP